MFNYEWRDSFLHKRNPVIKLAIILIVTILISLSLYPALPAFTFILSFIIGCIGAKYSPLEILKKMKIFIMAGFLFTFFLLIMKGLGGEGYTYQFWVLHWNKSDFISVLSLGTRIISISMMSILFVSTTDPNDLVLSLILQLKLSCVHGYAALAAYRFLPELQKEIDEIKAAQEIRGIEWNKGIINRLISPFRIMLPLLCNAARRGERVAAAMESRGLYSGCKRTYYKQTKIDRTDWIFLFAICILFISLMIVLSQIGMFRFSFGLSIK